jgi:hypothetical protein
MTRVTGDFAANGSIRRATIAPRLFGIVCVTAVCLLNGRSAQAQSAEAGLKGGVSLTSLTGQFTAVAPPPGESQPHKSLGVNWLIGWFIAAPMGRHVAFEPEVFYGRESITVHGTPFGAGPVTTTDEHRYRYDIVRVPLLFRFGPTSRGHSVGYVVAGPEIAVQFNGHDVIPGYWDIKDRNGVLTTASMAATTGAGARVGRFIIEGNFTFGLTPINDAPNGASPSRFLDYQKRRRMVISCLAGVTF